MKRAPGFCGVFLCAIGLALFLPGRAAGFTMDPGTEKRLADAPFRRIAVDGKPIPEAVLRTAMKLRVGGIAMFHEAPNEGRVAQFVKETEEKETGKELFLRDAERRGIVARENEYRSYEETQSDRYGGAEKLRAFLKGCGVTEEAYRAFSKRNFLVERYVQEVIGSKITVDEGEIDRGYREDRWTYEIPEKARFHSLAFLVLDNAAFSDEEKSLVLSLPGRVRSESDFAGEGSSLIEALKGKARCDSQQNLEWNAARGGDLWDMLSKIEPTRAGAYEAKGGRRYYTYFVKERVPGGVRTNAATARETIRNTLIAQKTHKAIDEKAAELKQGATISIE